MVCLDIISPKEKIIFVKFEVNNMPSKMSHMHTTQPHNVYFNPEISLSCAKIQSSFILLLKHSRIIILLMLLLRLVLLYTAQSFGIIIISMLLHWVFVCMRYINCFNLRYINNKPLLSEHPFNQHCCHRHYLYTNSV